MAEKKQNKSSIVQNKGVGSERNTFEGKIQYLSLNQLVDFKNHPFKVEMNTELFGLMQSIEKEGGWFRCLQDQIRQGRDMN